MTDTRRHFYTVWLDEELGFDHSIADYDIANYDSFHNYLANWKKKGFEMVGDKCVPWHSVSYIEYIGKFEPRD